jgi:5-methylcytosine-specific restriction enzyme A
MPPGWAATRRRIMARDGYTCSCGAPATEVHHLDPGAEADETLRAMCAPCHQAITATQAAAARRRRLSS